MKKIIILSTLILLTNILLADGHSSRKLDKQEPRNLLITSTDYEPGAHIDFYSGSSVKMSFSSDSFLPESDPDADADERKMHTIYWNIHLPSDLKNQRLGLFVGPARYPMDIYLNNILIAQFGSHEDPSLLNLSKYKSDNIPLPQDLLSYGNEQNFITIQVFPDFHNTPLPDLYIGSYHDIEGAVFWRSFFNYHFVQTALVLALFAGTFFYVFYFISPHKNKQHILYALLCTFFALAYVNMAFDHNTSNEVFLEKVSRVGFPFLVTVLTLFFAEYLGILKTHKKKLMLLFIPCVVSGLITIFQPDYASIQYYFSFTRVLYISPIMAINMIALMIAYYKKRSWDILIFLLTMIFCLSTATFDNFFLGRDMQPTFWLIPYGFFALTLVLFVFLALQQSSLMTELISKESNIKQFLAEIEKRKLVEKDLKIALKKADAANVAKSTFLANMSHEIRTPLNGIVGFAEIINNAGITNAVKEYSGLILRESEHLLDLINNILDISRIESNRIIIVSKIFDLKNSMEHLSDTYSRRIGNKRVEFQFEYDESLPRYVFGDKLRINQALKNLLDNAVKFTECGIIQFQISSDKNPPSEADQVNISFTINDTGIGISQDDQQYIFDRFQQADISSTRRYGGSGLGLTISKDLVHLMGGNLTLISTTNKGSCFSFTLPLTPARAEDIKLPDNQISEPNSVKIVSNPVVLVIEDNPTNRTVVSIHLKEYGCTILEAENGEIGVNLFEKASPDLILMDVQMPVLNGLDATRKIRSLESGKKIPIIGLTANAFTHDKTQCLEAGMNEVLTKPLRKVDLLNALCRQLRNKIERRSLDRGGIESSGLSSRVIDLKSLQQELKISDSNFYELLQGFLTDCSQHIRIMEDAVNSSQLSELHRAAHSIKGGARNMTANLLAEQSLLIEQMSKKLDPSIIPLLHPEILILKEIFNDLEKYILTSTSTNNKS